MADRYDHETLLAYVEGDLTDDARAQFEAQLKEDAELRRLVEGLVRDRTVLRELSSESPPPGMVDDAIQQLERQMLLGAPSEEPIPIESGKRPPRRHGVSKVLAYSGIAAIMLLSGGLIVLTLTGTNAIDTARRIVQLDRNDQQPDIDVPARPPGDVAMDDRNRTLKAPATRVERDRDAAEGSNGLSSSADGLASGDRLTLVPDEVRLPAEQGQEMADASPVTPQTGAADELAEFPWPASDWASRTFDTDAFALNGPLQTLEDTDAEVQDSVSTMAAASARSRLRLGSSSAAMEAAEAPPASLAVESAFSTAARTNASTDAPPWQVVVRSDDVEHTRAVLTDWVVHHRAVILPAGAAYRAGMAADRQSMRLRLEPRQLPTLVAELAADDDRQRVELRPGAGAAFADLPLPIAWDGLGGGASKFPPPLRQPKTKRSWAEVEVVIVPLDGETDGR